MSAAETGIVRAGARLLWSRQRVLWWVYGVNLLLGLLATLPMALRTGRVLNFTLASDRLVKALDLTVFFEVAAHPDVALMAQVPGSLLSLLVFFVFMLFLTGGLLEDFRREQRLTTAEFFTLAGSTSGASPGSCCSSCWHWCPWGYSPGSAAAGRAGWRATLPRKCLASGWNSPGPWFCSFS